MVKNQGYFLLFRMKMELFSGVSMIFLKQG